MDDNLDEETASKYEEIRAVASKNWLSSASVSLAKLDQVKARVYNVGFDIKGVTPGKAASHASNSTLNLEPDPPLANVVSQRTAWGSNTSIPDLIRQQSERQRPESAVHSRRVRPSSGKRQRPQSAKEAGSKQSGDGKPPNPSIAVKGAKFDPSSRPPKSTPHQNVTTGWVGVPAGVVLDPNHVEIDNSVQKYAKRNGRQVAKLSLAYAGDLTEPIQPPPPAASPDLTEYIKNGQPGNEDDAFISDDSLLSDEEKPQKPIVHPTASRRPPRPSSGKKKGKKAQKPEKLLRRPTPEPIHLSLPTADVDDSELDTERLLGSFEASGDANTSGNAGTLQFQLKPGFSYIHVDASGRMSQLDDLGEQDLDVQVETVKDEDLEDFIEDIEEVDFEDDVGSFAGEEEFEKQTVKFNEGGNITVDITPRNRGRPCSASNFEAKQRAYTGRSDLRFVKSRTDSGISLASTNQGALRRTASGMELGRPSSSQAGRVRSLVSRTRSTGRMKIPTVAVAYTDQEGEEKDSESMKRAKKELITMVSQISENDRQEDVERPESGKTYVSDKYRNHYRQAIGDGEQKVTTKTITLLGAEVMETKKVHRMDSHDHRRRDYQVPDENKPPKRTMISQVAQELSKSEQGSVDRPGDGQFSTSGKVRPSSSQILGQNKPEPPAEVKSRPKSASSTVKLSHEINTDKDVSSKENTVTKEVFVVEKPPKQGTTSRPVSANKVSSTKNGVKVSDAIKAIREGSGSKKKTPSNDPRKRANSVHAFGSHDKKKGTYASYTTRAKSAPVRSKRKPPPPAEPVYIFTRKVEPDWDTAEVQECKEVHNRLKENGINVAVETLKRALLPPMDSSSYITKDDKPPLPNPSSGLLHSPAVWLAAEFKRLQLANKAVERANERLFMQKLAEERAANPKPQSATTRKKKVGKGKKKIKRASSAGL